MSKILPWIQQHRRPLFIAGPVLLLLIIISLYVFTRHEVSTDDAYTKAGNASISANVAGQVTKILVRDNQAVKKGQALFQIDPRPYHIAVAYANAELENAYLNVRALKTIYQEKLTQVQMAEDNLAYQSEELTRQKKMLAAGLSSQRALDKIQNAFNNATQQLAATKQQQANALAQLDNNPEIADDDIPLVKTALAKLKQAQLNLSYTSVTASMDGVVTKVDNLQLGDYITVGAPVFVLISSQHPWIEANFKETQITNIIPGDKAVITLDAYPGKKWLGHVDSISPGSGSTFALLPPENATGNWVKVGQRVPIRIVFDDMNKNMIPSGLSANVTVTTQTSSSHE